MKEIVLSVLGIICFLGSPAQKPEVIVQTYHSAQVTCMAFSPDGRYFATGSKDNSIKVWEVSSGLLIATFNGYQFEIISLRFTKNSGYLISNGDINEVKIWSIADGKEITFFKQSEMVIPFIKGIDLDSAENVLTSIEIGGKIEVWDMSKKTKVSSFSAGLNGGGNFEIAADGNKIFLLNKQGGKCFNSSGKILKTFTSNPATTETRLHLSSGRYAQGLSNGSVLVKNLADNTILSTLQGPALKVTELHFSPKGNYLIASYKMNNYFIWNLSNGQQLFQDERIYQYSFSQDEKQIFIATQKSGAQIIDLSKNAIITKINRKYNDEVSLGLNENSGYAALVDENNTTCMFNSKDGTLIREIYRIISIPQHANVSNNTLHVITKNGNYFSVGLFDLKRNDYCEHNSSLQQIQWNNSNTPFLLCAATNPSCTEKISPFQTAPGFIQSKKTATGLLLIANNSLQFIASESGTAETFFSSSSPIIDADVTSDARYFAVVYQNGIRIYDKKSGAEINKIINVNYSYTSIRFSPDGKFFFTLDEYKYLRKHETLSKKKYFEVSDPDGLATISTEKHAVYPLIISADGNTVYFMGEEFKILEVDAQNGEIKNQLKAHTAWLNSLEWTDNNKRLVSTSDDGTTIIWNLETAKPNLTLLSSDKDWVVFNNDGYYSFNRYGQYLIGFKLGTQITSFEVFDLKYNRPDLILKSCGASDVIQQNYLAAYRKRLAKEGLSEVQLNSVFNAIPEVVIKGKNKIPIQSTSEFLNISIEAKDNQTPLHKVLVCVNGSPVVKQNLNQNNFSKELKIKLSEGKNIIRVQTTNKNGFTSMPEIVNLNYTPTKRSKPNLYLLVLAVTEYQDASMNLKYTIKDGRDLIAEFSKQKNYYNQIIIDTLFNQKATKANLLALKQKYAMTKPEDVVIMAMSGHGLLDNEMNFYFATVAIDFKNPRQNGLAYSDIESFLEGLPARRKLLLLDACHSGEADKGIETKHLKTSSPETNSVDYTTRGSELLFDENNANAGTDPFHLMQQLFSSLNMGSGIVAITAAAGNSYALESDKWKNGVFTYSLLQLLSMAKEPLTVSKLKTGIEEKVESLTQGRQKPTSRSENLDSDWTVWY